MDEQALLKRALQIRRNLIEQGGYWAFDPSQAMQVGPEPLTLTRDQASEARTNGYAVFKFWEQAQKVYLDSCLGVLPAWVAASVEGPLTSEQRNAQMMVASMNELPRLARLDLSSFWFPVEIQERLGFLGGCASWHKANDREGYPEGLKPVGRGPESIPSAFASMVCGFSFGASRPTVALVAPEGYLSEQAYLARYLQSIGIETLVVDRDTLLAGTGVELFKGGLVIAGRGIDFLYRREVNAATLVKHEGGLKVLKSVLDGKLVVEPPLSMLYDTKAPFAWVHHPWLRDYFSDDVRELIPLTTLLPATTDAMFKLGNAELTLDDILSLSNSQRSYVLKYAGPSIEYGLGGRAVYSLEDTSKVARKVVDLALGQVAEGHPWVIQRKDDERFPTTYLAGGELITCPTMHARLLFFYQRIAGVVSLFAAHGNFRNNWKTGGNKDAVFRVICE